uniref:45 kDa calcium-binding protein-like n=1 Tax=Styela clava TaxID=7725 RepID=UPI001939FBF6|nr:45 kDa calcium-binding protein-like [Styela clava]
MVLKYIVFVIFTFLNGVCYAGVIHQKLNLGNFTGGKEDALDNQDLGPPDHLDAVKFERDGDMNAEFYHEIFLGEEKHHFHEKKTKGDKLKKLEEIFHRADVTNDNYIEEGELHAWIMMMVNDHMKQATTESENKFKLIVGEKATVVNFEQFHAAFIKSLRNFNASHDGKSKFNQQYIETRLHTIKEEWAKADLNNDGNLSKKEFLLFQHPEMSNATLMIACKDFMEERDYDSNNKLDVKEFVFGFPVGDDINLDDYADGDDLIRDKIHQFRKYVDVDGDGFLTLDELMVYLDPFSNLNARNDAHDMMFYVDSDADGKLTLDEVKQASEYLTGTKLFDASSFFHNEL